MERVFQLAHALAMNADANIVLVGFMGAGKSAVGRKLAARLDRTFVDTDTLIESIAHRPIAAIFDREGEPAFRLLERSVVESLCEQRNLVIAGGGGIVLNADNMRDFKRTGFLVCLRAAPEEIVRRVRNERHRPLLQGDDPPAAIRRLLDQRRPFYDAVPVQVDTDGRTPAEVADQIAALFLRERAAAD